MCAFTDCADSGEPIRVLGVDAAGRRFVDVTKRRRDAVERDAAQLWASYRREPGIGLLAPYCADEYRLGRRTRCDRMLPPKIRRQLAAWGYR
jgi:hypothetical protein